MSILPILQRSNHSIHIQCFQCDCQSSGSAFNLLVYHKIEPANHRHCLRLLKPAWPVITHLASMWFVTESEPTLILVGWYFYLVGRNIWYYSSFEFFLYGIWQACTHSRSFHHILKLWCSLRSQLVVSISKDYLAQCQNLIDWNGTIYCYLIHQDDL